MFLQTLFPFPLITEVRSEGLSVNLWRLSACVIDGFWSHNRDHFCSPHSVIFPSFNTCGGWCLLYNLRLKSNLEWGQLQRNYHNVLLALHQENSQESSFKLWFYLLKLPLLKNLSFSLFILIPSNSRRKAAGSAQPCFNRGQDQGDTVHLQWSPAIPLLGPRCVSPHIMNVVCKQKGQHGGFAGQLYPSKSELAGTSPI